MFKVATVFVGLAVLLCSCTQRLICPAFQSSYIYDQEELRKKFSYFKEDSTPKILTASKNKFLIAESVPYKKKERGLFTVEMKPVYPNVPDSLTVKDDSFAEELRKDTDSVATQPAQDSVALAQNQDSTYVITVDREVRVIKYDPFKREYRVEEIGYNVEEDNYMWYLRDVLVLPDVKIAMAQKDKQETSEAKKKKGIKGFFKGLFGGKKAKKDSVSTAPVAPENEDQNFNFVDTTATQQNDQVPATEKKKKKIFSFGKKSKEQDSENPPVESQPAEEEKPADDGF